MTIPNPLVITVNSVAKNLPRINQDSYGSEYYLLEPTQSFRVKIRHNKEGVLKNGDQFDRHNVELTQTIFGTAPAPDVTLQTYVVLRNTKATTGTTLGYLQSALNGLLTAGFVSDLKGWQN